MVFSNDIPFPRLQSSLSNFCICFLLRANHGLRFLFVVIFVCRKKNGGKGVLMDLD
ncbi:hypothetical protein Hanom_Chr00s016322g01756051 [Helianthus anomalus]